MMLHPIIRGRPDKNHIRGASHRQETLIVPTIRWSQHVTETSDALDLDQGVFSWSDPKRIAASLKRSAEASKRRKGTPLQSAMSMLNFYINRAGHTLPAKQKRILEQAKDELHKLFDKSETRKS
jgi:hypothetical protein